MRCCLETTWPRISRPLIKARLQKLRVFLIETKLPAGLRHSRDHPGGGEFAKSDARNLEPAHVGATTATDLAAIDQPGRAGVSRQLGE